MSHTHHNMGSVMKNLLISSKSIEKIENVFEKNLVLFHAKCADGFGAALAASLFFEQQGKFFDFLDVSYNEPIPSIVGNYEAVYILDFSYSVDGLNEIANQVKSVVVVDHHKTSIASITEDVSTLKENIFLKLDIEKSGCVLAWEFFDLGEIPALYKYLQDRDLWLNELPGTSLINRAIKVLPYDFEAWKVYLNDTGLLLKEGEVLKKAMQHEIMQARNRVIWGRIKNMDIPLVNTAIYESDIANDLCNEFKEAAFGGTFHIEKNSKVKFELRSISEFDVSRIAEDFGGGGHQNAAGFRIDLSDLSKII